MKLQETLKEKIEYIDAGLEQYLKVSHTPQKQIYEAMGYSVFAGGKRLRPILMLAAFEAVGGQGEQVLPFACALEMIHTYSLIHDDLPAMDNDDYRRGKLTNHKVYGEGIAILAGDGLLNLAFEIMIKAGLQYGQDICLQAMDVIARAAGTEGMIGGQVVDLLSENTPVEIDIVEYIHENKTAALIQAAVKAGGILGGGDPKQIQLLERFGYCLGMAFQVQDDILDVTSTTEELGKPVQSDIKNQKSTFVSLVGLEKSKEYVERLSMEAIESLQGLGERGELLIRLANYLMDRSY